MAKYINQLTVEDIEAISELCFKSNEHVDRIFFPMPEVRDNILVISIFGNELIVGDFGMIASEEYEEKKYAQKIFATYMYKKFGDQYMSDYANHHYSLASLRNVAKEALENFKAAKKKAISEVNILRDFAGRVFPNGLEGIQEAAIMSYLDPEDLEGYDYVEDLQRPTIKKGEK